MTENDYPKCPVCGAPSGQDCRTVQGAIPPHAERFSTPAEPKAGWPYDGSALADNLHAEPKVSREAVDPQCESDPAAAGAYRDRWVAVRDAIMWEQADPTLRNLNAMYVLSVALSNPPADGDGWRDIDRDRLAEVLYELDGFFPPMPDRDTPVWVAESAVAEHSGDCTKQPWTCMRCHAEEYRERAAAVIDKLVPPPAPLGAGGSEA